MYNYTLSLTSTLDGVDGQHRTGRITPQERNSVHITQEKVWAPGPVRTDAENLSPTEIRSPASPAHSEPLCLLHYPCSWTNVIS